MFPKDKERGLRIPIIRRFGLKGFPAWNGLNKQNDRGALNPVQFWELVNLRNSGGSWDVRGGTSAPINSNAFTGCVTGLIDLPGTTSGILVNGVTLDLDPYGTDICTLYDPNINTFAALNLATIMAQAHLPTPKRTMLLHDGQIYFYDIANSGHTLAILTLSVVGGQTITDTRAVSSILNLPYAPCDLHSAFGKIWISTSAGYAYSWDGTTLTAIATAFPSHPMQICSFQESICVAGQELFAVYNPGAETWTTLVLPAHTGTFKVQCMAACPTVNKLYFGGYYDTGGPQSNPVLFSYNGTTITEEFTYVDVSASENWFDGVTDVLEWNGVATFIWHRWGVDATGEVYIGTVADPYIVPIGDTVTTNAVGACLFVDSNSQLYASINAEWDAADSPNRIIRRDGTTLGGYWHTDTNYTGWTPIGGAQWGAGGTYYPPTQLLSQL